MSDPYRDLHGDAYREWKESEADEYTRNQREAFLAGFEACADEAESFRLLRQWLEEQRDETMESADQSDDGDRMMWVRSQTYREVLVKLSEMGCAPESGDDG